MKKKDLTLSLGRETLRSLTEVSQLVGGRYASVNASVCYTCFVPCAETNSCGC